MDEANLVRSIDGHDWSGSLVDKFGQVGIRSESSRIRIVKNGKNIGIVRGRNDVVTSRKVKIAAFRKSSR
jgi:hypothetical protein